VKLLLLSFYFPPDLSAGSFRMSALLEALLAGLPAGAQIDLVTTQPNRYATLQQDAPEVEERGAARIYRIPLPPHRSGMGDQARAFFAYDRAVARLVRGKRYDLVFATSSRLMTAFLGARLARAMHAPLYLDIRDIFVDTLGDVLPGVKGRLLAPLFAAVERYTMQSAARINLVSEGFREYFATRYPSVSLEFFSNGIDDDFLSVDWRPTTAVPAGGRLRVVYAGNIGEGQGLHKILPGLVRRAGERYTFTVVGDGGRRALLVEELKKAGVTNVRLLSPVPRKQLIELYRDADVLFLHLNDYPAFAKVLPSKIFEYAATGRPVLAGVGGYAGDFVAREVTNSAVFSPCDAEGGARALHSLELGWSPRIEFIQKFSRATITGRFASSLLETCTQSTS